MTNKIISSNIKGISYREHTSRKHGRQKDKYFIIRYTANKKRITEAVGWASEGWTLNEAKKILARIKKNIKLGLHPQSLKEIREKNESEYKQKQENK